MASPNFLVIGAQRSGTTWISHMLRQHPDLYAPETKELHFFDREGQFSQGLEYYLSHFSTHKGEKAIGEFTPNYLWTVGDEKDLEKATPEIPERVSGSFPHMKIIVTLRNPAHRAISAYYHHLRKRRFPPYKRIGKTLFRYGIGSMGYYADQLRSWFRCFDRRQFHILFYEDEIDREPALTLKRLFEFLGIDPDFQPDSIEKRINPRPGSSSVWLGYYFPSFSLRYATSNPRFKSMNFPRISIRTREMEFLNEFYRDRNRDLEDLLERKLPSSWIR